MDTDSLFICNSDTNIPKIDLDLMWSIYEIEQANFVEFSAKINPMFCFEYVVLYIHIFLPLFLTISSGSLGPMS